MDRQKDGRKEMSKLTYFSLLNETLRIRFSILCTTVENNLHIIVFRINQPSTLATTHKSDYEVYPNCLSYDLLTMILCLREKPPGSIPHWNKPL